jgi:hypothetical protein
VGRAGAEQRSEVIPEKKAPKHTELESAFGKMLSGATLEGSFTSTGEGSDPAELSREKYTLGEVKKLQGDYWLIPARIQYGEKDVTIPLTLPVRWAGDTPMIVVDEVGLPGFGTVSARVMFFADHYAGYWKHGKSGGHLFGVISRDQAQKSPDSGDAAGGEQEQQKPGE